MKSRGGLWFFLLSKEEGKGQQFINESLQSLINPDLVWDNLFLTQLSFIYFSPLGFPGAPSAIKISKVCVVLFNEQEFASSLKTW